MLLEVIETVFGSLAVITCSSLWFASVIDKRDRKDDEPEPPPPRILPWLYVTTDTQCQQCGAGRSNDGNCDYGPNKPEACDDDGCAAKDIPHLHMYCNSCESSWFMAPKPVDQL